MSSPLRFAVILSGCGVYDGSEIHESVLTFLAIHKAGGQFQAFAPAIAQSDVIDHITATPMPETRQVLQEAARLTRGDILNLRDFDPADFDILVLPGGFGAAKNLSSFARDGANCTVNPDVEQAIKAAHGAQMPIGAWCIAPAVVARVLGNVTLTIGNDPGTAQALEAMGARHLNAATRDAVTDSQNRVVSTPCYMTGGSLADISTGIEGAISSLISLVKKAV